MRPGKSELPLGGGNPLSPNFFAPKSLSPSPCTAWQSIPKFSGAEPGQQLEKTRLPAHHFYSHFTGKVGRLTNLRRRAFDSMPGYVLIFSTGSSCGCPEHLCSRILCGSLPLGACDYFIFGQYRELAIHDTSTLWRATRKAKTTLPAHLWFQLCGQLSRDLLKARLSLR